jgi:hypothetical protein
MELYLHSRNTPSWRGARSKGTTFPLLLNLSEKKHLENRKEKRNNMKADIRKTGSEDEMYMEVAMDLVQWRTLVRPIAILNTLGRLPEC